MARHGCFLFKLKFKKIKYCYVIENARNMIDLYISGYIVILIIYIEMILNCDWSISVQLIPNRSAKICNKHI